MALLGMITKWRKSFQYLFGIQTPKLFRSDTVPKDTGKPQSDSDLDGPEYDIMGIAARQIDSENGK